MAAAVPGVPVSVMRHCARVVRLRPLLSVAIVGFGLPVFALGAISIGGNSRGLDRGAGPLKAGAQPGATLPRRELDTLAGQRVTARQLPVVRAGVKGFWVGPSVRHGTYAVYAPPQQRAFRPVAGQRVALTGVIRKVQTRDIQRFPLTRAEAARLRRARGFVDVQAVVPAK